MSPVQYKHHRGSIFPAQDGGLLRWSSLKRDAKEAVLLHESRDAVGRYIEDHAESQLGGADGFHGGGRSTPAATAGRPERRDEKPRRARGAQCRAIAEAALRTRATTTAQTTGDSGFHDHREQRRYSFGPGSRDTRTRWGAARSPRLVGPPTDAAVSPSTLSDRSDEEAQATTGQVCTLLAPAGQPGRGFSIGVSRSSTAEAHGEHPRRIGHNDSKMKRSASQVARGWRT